MMSAEVNAVTHIRSSGPAFHADLYDILDRTGALVTHKPNPTSSLMSA